MSIYGVRRQLYRAASALGLVSAIQRGPGAVLSFLWRRYLLRLLFRRR